VILEDKTMIKTTIEFLRNVYVSGRIEGSRAKVDIFADRLQRAGCEATLNQAMELLVRGMNVEIDRMDAAVVCAMWKLGAGPDADRVLVWLRDQHRMVAMLAATSDDALRAEVVGMIALPAAASRSSHVAALRGKFDIEISVKCVSPLAHGSDSKAGNASLFRRQKVLVEGGTVLQLPYYGGNAVRGLMRDLLADYLLQALDIPISRNQPSIALWFFHALYAGGALEEKSAATKAVIKRLGDNGATRTDGIRKFRDMLPGLSLLGCALGNRVLPGHVQFGDLRPCCREWGHSSEVSVNDLMTWEYLTRREDLESHTEHHGMIASMEVLRAGVELEGGVGMDLAIPSIEKAALVTGLQLIKDRGYLGANNRMGLGMVEVEFYWADAPDLSYAEWLGDNKLAIREYLQEIGALV
jgi:hypothetical protein